MTRNYKVRRGNAKDDRTQCEHSRPNRRYRGRGRGEDDYGRRPRDRRRTSSASYSFYDDEDDYTFSDSDDSYTYSDYSYVDSYHRRDSRSRRDAPVEKRRQGARKRSRSRSRSHSRDKGKDGGKRGRQDKNGEKERTRTAGKTEEKNTTAPAALHAPLSAAATTPAVEREGKTLGQRATLPFMPLSKEGSAAVATTSAAPLGLEVAMTAMAPASPNTPVISARAVDLPAIIHLPVPPSALSAVSWDRNHVATPIRAPVLRERDDDDGPAVAPSCSSPAPEGTEDWRDVCLEKHFFVSTDMAALQKVYPDYNDGALEQGNGITGTRAERCAAAIVAEGGVEPTLSDLTRNEGGGDSHGQLNEMERVFREHFDTGLVHSKPPWFLCASVDDNREHPQYLRWLDSLDIPSVAQQLSALKHRGEREPLVTPAQDSAANTPRT